MLKDLWTTIMMYDKMFIAILSLFVHILTMLLGRRFTFEIFDFWYSNQRLWLSGASRSCFHAQARLLSPGHEAGKSSLHGSGRRQDRWLWPREGGQITASVHRICLDSVVSCTRSPTSVNDVLSADWYLGSRVHHGRVVHIQTPVSGQLGDWRNLQDLFRARDSGQTRLAGIVSPRRRHELQVPAVFTDPVEQDHHERVSRSELRFRSLDKPNDSK